MARYLAIGRLSDNVETILAHSSDVNKDPLRKSFKTHVKQIMGKAFKLQPGKRICLTADSHDYEVHVVADLMDTPDGSDDKTLIVFFAVADPSFGRKHNVSMLLKEMRTELFAACTAEEVRTAVAKGVVQTKSATFLQTLLSRYGGKGKEKSKDGPAQPSDAKRIEPAAGAGPSKLDEVQDKVEEVKGALKDSVQMSLLNVEKMEDLEAQTGQLEESSESFDHTTHDIRRLEQRSKRKYVIIGGVVMMVGAALLMIGIAVLAR